jgi:WXG100 family type VII secretion target
MSGSSERERMNVPSVEKMAQTFQQAKSQLTETMQQMGKMSQQMGDGALQGDGGAAFVDAINNKLNKRLKVLAEKMGELQKDCKDAIAAVREAEGQAKGRFQ